MTTNSQLSSNEPKRKEKQWKQKTKQTRTGTESEEWTSQGGISVGSGEGGVEGEMYREE